MPAPRAMHTAVVNEAAGKMYIFGGHSLSKRCGDTTRCVHALGPCLTLQVVIESTSMSTTMQIELCTPFLKFAVLLSSAACSRSRQLCLLAQIQPGVVSYRFLVMQSSLHVCFGPCSCQPLGDLWEYDFASSAWTELPRRSQGSSQSGCIRPSPRCGHASWMAGRSLYVLGALRTWPAACFFGLPSSVGRILNCLA